eukprot:8347840-Pyramimonas_sp.AAC.1
MPRTASNQSSNSSQSVFQSPPMIQCSFRALSWWGHFAAASRKPMFSPCAPASTTTKRADSITMPLGLPQRTCAAASAQ